MGNCTRPARKEIVKFYDSDGITHTYCKDHDGTISAWTDEDQPGNQPRAVSLADVDFARVPHEKHEPLRKLFEMSRAAGEHPKQVQPNGGNPTKPNTTPGSASIEPSYEPIPVAKVEDVPKHLWHGIRRGGIVRVLSKVADDGTAKDKFNELISKSKQELEQKGSNKFKESVLEKRQNFVAQWAPSSVNISYKSMDRKVVEEEKTSLVLSCDGYDFLDAFVKPHLRTLEAWDSTSLCETLQQEAAEQGLEPMVQNATCFVSHAQKEPLWLTLSAICERLNERVGPPPKNIMPHNPDATFVHDEKKEFHWMDYFTLRQLAKGEFDPKYVACIITTIRTTLILVDVWDSITVVTRLWCTFELVVSASNANCSTILPKVALVADAGQCLKRLRAITVQQAETQDEENRGRILATMVAGGKDTDREVRSTLLKALTAREKFDATTPSICTFLEQLGEEYGDVIEFLHIEKDLQQSLANFTKVTTLRCWHMPKSISAIPSMKQLLELSFRESMIEAVPAEVGQFVSLQILDVSWCVALKQLPARIGNCSALTELNCQSCRELKELPGEIGKCKALKTLKIQGVGIMELPKELGECLELDHIIAFACKQLTTLPKELAKCSKLRQINIQYCTNVNVENFGEELREMKKNRRIAGPET